MILRPALVALALLLCSCSHAQIDSERCSRAIIRAAHGVAAACVLSAASTCNLDDPYLLED